MDEDKPKRGRPKGSTTGQKPLRTLRSGAIWDRSKQLADEWAALHGESKGNMTAYVEAALREHNAYIERRLKSLRRAQAD